MRCFRRGVSRWTWRPFIELGDSHKDDNHIVVCVVFSQYVTFKTDSNTSRDVVLTLRRSEYNVSRWLQIYPYLEIQYKDALRSHSLIQFSQDKLIKINVYSWFRAWYFIVSRLLPSLCRVLPRNIVSKFHTCSGVGWCERQTLGMEWNVPRIVFLICSRPVINVHCFSSIRTEIYHITESLIRTFFINFQGLLRRSLIPVITVWLYVFFLVGWDVLTK
jgi:hypothetical protein